MLKPRWNKGPVEASGSEVTRGRTARTVLTSQLCSAGEKISQLCDQLHFWQDQSQDLQKDLQEKLLLKAAVDARLERRSALSRQLSQLQAELRRRREGLQRLKDFSTVPLAGHAVQGRLELFGGALQACAWSQHGRSGASMSPEQLLQAQEALQDLQLHLAQTLRAEQLEAKRSLQRSWLRLRCQRLRKLYEVREVYPVQPCNSYWTIRGICLRGTESLRHQDPREEREASTALGYLSHLLASAAALLQVPLHLELSRVGSSRCIVVDPFPNASPGRTLLPRGPATWGGRPFGRERRLEGEWPLHYGRAIEKSHFETAVKLLEQSLHQFIYSRGYHKSVSPNDNLLKCADVIFTQEIYSQELEPLRPSG